MTRITKVAVGVLCLILIVFPLLVNPYIVQIAITTITYSLLGLAFAFSMKAGLPRIDIAAWCSIGSFTTALLMNAGMSFWLAALTGGLISMILGWLLFSVAIPRGILIFFIYCMMWMLLAPNVIRFLFMLPFLRGAGGLIPPPTIGSYVIFVKRDLFYVGLFFLGLNLVVYHLLYNSKIGRAWDAINSSLKLARSVGVNVVRYRMSNILIGNFFISLAGSYLVAFNRVPIPLTFDIKAGVLIMAYPFIGGLTHSLTGPILGAAIITFIPEYFRVIEEYQLIVTTIIMMLIIMFLPKGILGWLDQRVKPWLKRSPWYVHLSKWGTKEEREILW
jgi:branched-chain amino acid transport system permease protein